MANHIDGPLYYERMGRTGPVMAFVHPNPMDQSCWIFQMAHMSTWFRCIAIDIPGYGRSPKCRNGVTMNDIAAGLLGGDRRDRAGRERDPGRLLGRLAIITYMHHIRPAKTSGADHVRHRLQSRQGVRPPVASPTTRNTASISAGTTPSRTSARRFAQTPLATYFADMFAERNRFGDIDTIIQQFEAHAATEPEDHEAKIACPSIILTGSEDNTHKIAFALQERIQNCELKVLPGAGHACQIEQPVAVQPPHDRIL